MLNEPSVLLLGLESSGKSALFRGLTGAIGDEANFRGSTVVCRRCRSAQCGCDVIDAPGIRIKDDTAAARLALGQIAIADTVVLVARGTHLRDEVTALLAALDLQGKKSALVVTFADKAAPEVASLAEVYRKNLGIPVAVVDARQLHAGSRAEVVRVVASARTLPPRVSVHSLPSPPVRNPASTLFDHALFGRALAVLSIFLMFGAPVYAAYLLSGALQPPVDIVVITPMKEWLEKLPPALFALFGGDYGVLTLGWYSFLWALPVVVFLGVSVAVAEETGLKDRITAVLDPWMRRVGLSGRDLIPVLAGFGCNVVAVHQSRACSACTRRACVSMIAYGSACSYQIGASLSIFGASGHPGLFVPYLATLFLVGAIHTRIWHGGLALGAAQPLNERAFLQWPSCRAVSWRVAATVKQFLLQAMPIFLMTCLCAALLQHVGILEKVAAAAAPTLATFHLPASAAPGVLFSILRKDGLLVLNQGDGALLHSLGTGQVFVLVYLASTLTACLVTLWTIRRELGWKEAVKLATRQAATCLVSTWLLSLFLA